MKKISLLFTAITIEVIGTLFMNQADGFTRLFPSIMVFVCYFSALVLCIYLVRELEVGFVNALWSGLGTFAVILLGIWFFNESVSLMKFIGMGFVVAGVVLLNLNALAEKRRVS
ncbi:ethidium bromide-methyl viologen resistance protein EmrE [Bacillus sp. JCM 19046]|uniref:Small multidrug resistance pump n=1 Tax=Shouchella xiaoxiensis TaxID=766895 RepID=A0ABS2SS18_9BACI|nr:multidrug efflux SMR transporter [Shouchella xiaoxiensis]MBM7837309.1 small multidrug resistance pump [Shouchella xiaoxiensis]GAF11499.1 ethidium bromide-methyl viologen resistance protein EmrE [Bacillus sp. JCM 19045]GAF16962.1 ethidium bromide-methyl viologen resistance protein EmrE [Bacillus sp. JCM 19046]